MMGRLWPGRLEMRFPVSPVARASAGHLIQSLPVSDHLEPRRFAHVRIMERRETISSAKSARGVLGFKESDDTRRSR